MKALTASEGLKTLQICRPEDVQESAGQRLEAQPALQEKLPGMFYF